MYDVEIAMPISNIGKYGNRLNDLKKFGLMNIGSKKVRLKLLIGQEFIPNILEGWPADVDVSVFSSDFNHVVAKIYAYYNSLKDASDCRWFCKFDDDSLNDISGLVDNLDKDFDYEREYYIVTEIRNEMQPTDADIIRKCGLGHWFNPGTKIPLHEKEGCVLSQAAMKRILNTPKSIELIKLRSEWQAGWGDAMLAYAARAAKIHVCDGNFLTSNPHFGNFSYYGGLYSHIHFICNDKTPVIIDFLNKNKNTLENPNIEKILNKDFIFLRNERAPIATLQLKSNGSIDASNYLPNEKFWYFLDGKLFFLNSNCIVTTVFDSLSNNLDGFSGKCCGSSSIIHSLRQIV